MENKYYTPKVEDLLIGYECEIKAPEFKGRTFIVDEDQIQYAAFCIRGEFLFTAYLTTEQIEAEGWEWEKGLYSFKKETEKANYYLTHNSPKVRIAEYTKRDTKDPWSMQARSIAFDGNCPSINEFRFIMKLLGINATKNTTKEVH